LGKHFVIWATFERAKNFHLSLAQSSYRDTWIILGLLYTLLGEILLNQFDLAGSEELYLLSKIHTFSYNKLTTENK